MMAVIDEKNTTAPILTCEKLVIGYRRRAILPPIDFTLHRGELCAVVGRNGAGKTTWFRTLLGLLPSIAGVIRHEQKPLSLGYIAQRVELTPMLPILAQDIVEMGLERGWSFLWPFSFRDRCAQIQRALDRVNATDLAKTPFGELSEGQKQRVLIARLLVGNPDIAVLDEPTAAMDAPSEHETLHLIKQLCVEQNLATLIVSHDIDAVRTIADRIVFIDRATQTVLQGTPTSLLKHDLVCAQCDVPSKKVNYDDSI